MAKIYCTLPCAFTVSPVIKLHKLCYAPSYHLLYTRLFGNPNYEDELLLSVVKIIHTLNCGDLVWAVPNLVSFRYIKMPNEAVQTADSFLQQQKKTCNNQIGCFYKSNIFRMLVYCKLPFTSKTPDMIQSFMNSIIFAIVNIFWLVNKQHVHSQPVPASAILLLEMEEQWLLEPTEPGKGLKWYVDFTALWTIL